MDTHAASWFDLALQMNQLLLSSRINGQHIDFGSLECGNTPLDLDTFAMDNAGTQKELIGRTYAGVDGYCPFAVYLGSLGYCLELALRPGVQQRHPRANTTLNEPCRWPQVWCLRPCWCVQTRAFVLQS